MASGEMETAQCMAYDESCVHMERAQKHTAHAPSGSSCIQQDRRRSTVSSRARKHLRPMSIMSTLQKHYRRPFCEQSKRGKDF